MTLPKPYYQDERNGITIFNGDCREILPSIEGADMIFTDPPYGHNNNNGDLIHRWEAALRRPPSGLPAEARHIANDGEEANELVRWFFQQKPGAACKWFDLTDKIENIIRPGQFGIRKIIPSKNDHPTPKPMALAAHFIKLHSEPGDIILDPFLGGGSTAEAAKMMGRRFIGIEIDERWCEKAIGRLSQGFLSLHEAPELAQKKLAI